MRKLKGLRRQHWARCPEVIVQLYKLNEATALEQFNEK
jgi:hypothetical protein